MRRAHVLPVKATRCRLSLTFKIKSWWRHQMEAFPRYWPLCGKFSGHRCFPAQRSVTLIFDVFCTWINGRVNTREDGDLTRHRAHYDVTVMSNLLIYSFRHCVIGFVQLRLLYLISIAIDWIAELKIIAWTFKINTKSGWFWNCIIYIQEAGIRYEGLDYAVECDPRLLAENLCLGCLSL